MRYATVTVWPIDDENDARLPPNYDLYSVEYDGAPFANWLHGVSDEILKQCEENCTIKGKYLLKGPTEFVIAGTPIMLKAFGFSLDCTVGFVSQIVRPDVSLGYFDHLRGRITVPSQQFYNFGMLDNEAWESTDSSWSDPSEMEPGTFALQLTMFAPVPTVDGKDVPDLDALIAASEITCGAYEGSA